jgi:hypothetical protein
MVDTSKGVVVLKNEKGNVFHVSLSWSSEVHGNIDFAPVFAVFYSASNKQQLKWQYWRCHLAQQRQAPDTY